MTRREKILAGSVAGTGVLWFAMSGVDRYRTAVDRNEGLAYKASAALDDAEFAIQRGERAKRQLIDWAKRSLPTDRDVAKSLYQDWVRAQLTLAGLTIEALNDKTLNGRLAHFGELSLEARATGTMEQLADFLYKFYAAPHLHRISAATITSAEKGAKLTALLGIDALILPDSPRSTELAAGEEQKLPQTLEEFRTSLASRNMFAPHTPAGDGGAGQANGTLVSAFMSDGEGGWHLWLSTNEPAKTHKFKPGDKLAFGSFTGELLEVDERHAVIKTDKGRVELRLGQNLGEATPIIESST